MRKAVGFFLAAASLLLAGVAPAVAQVQTGSLSIKAVDDQGAIMPGATVTITSPVLPRAIEGVTDTGGVFQVPGLTPGTYTIKIALQGFQAYIREDVILKQGQTVSIEAPMKVGTLNEAITVKGESPVVDTRTVGAKTNIDSALLESTPGGKDIWNILEYKAPGVVVETPDVGGNQGGLQRSMSARGTPNAQNTQLLNGVNVNDPAAQGFSMNYYIPSAFDNIQVSTGAQDIAIGTGGVLINMVTKSGTNTFQGEGLQTYQSRGTQSSNVDDVLLSQGFRPDANSTELISNSNFQLGGPMLKNRMFFFGSANYQATHVNVPDFPSAVPSYIPTPLSDTSAQDTTDIIAGEGKITYQLGPANRFEGYVSKQRYDKPNRGAASGLTQDSDSKELDTFVISQLAYNRVLNARMFMDAKVSYNNTHFPLYQKTDLQPLTDQSNNNALYRNRGSSQIMYRRRVQTIANLQYYLPNFAGGRHEFKGGFDNGYTPEDVDTLRVDDVNVSFRSASTPAAATTVTIFNTPLHQVRAVNSTAFYGQDSFTKGRLNVIAGIRWERIEGYLPAQTTPTSRFFPDGLVFQGVTINGAVQNYTVQKNFAAVHDNPLWYNWAPRVAGTYDLFGNGKTALKVSWGRYLDQINTGTPPNPNANINQQYVWNDLNGDLIFQPGNATWDGLKYVGGEFGALNTTNGLAVAAFDKSVRRPKRDEITVTVDHELFRNFLLDVSYLHTQERDPQGTIDNSIDLWSSQYTPLTLTDPGRDGLVGTADDAPLLVYNQNAGVTTTSKTINDDRLANRYNGLDVIVTKRFEAGWTLLAGYTYSQQTVDLTSLANPNNAFVNASGVSGGRRHNFKASGSYTLPYKVLVAANFRLQSGLPITRTWAVPTCSASVTTNCTRQTLTVNAEPRGSVELGTLPTLDIRAGRFFDFRRDRLDLSVDVYNLTNANTIFGVRTGTGTTGIRANGDLSQPLTQITTFLSPTQFLAPRVVRFNVTYSFNRR
jgi:Carboxypeptidase regulatory-like domain/TonB-dependent Receptor Plug Domain